MKKILFAVLVIMMGSANTKAQSNLILNPSFESHYDTCFPALGGFDYGQVDSWSCPNHSTPDYFSPISIDGIGCSAIASPTTPPINGFGFEYPHTGYAYAGWVAYLRTFSFREYIQGMFSHPLVSGQTYPIEYYISLAELSTCFSDFGFFFSDTLVSVSNGDSVLNYTPQYENPPSNMITQHIGWQRVTGSYTAHGGERYVSIGVFKDGLLVHQDLCLPYSVAPIDQRAYVFLDDVAVYDTAKVDTIHLCLNDSVQLGGIWRHNAGLFTDMIGGLPVKFYIEPRSYSINLTIIDRPFLNGDSTRISLSQMGGIDSTFGSQNFTWIKNDTIIEIPMYNIYGCDSTIRYRCGTHIGIGNELMNNLLWSIYPNPSNDYIEVKLSINDPTKYSVTIIDVAGREVLTHSLVDEKIDISTLKSGMYFMKLTNTKTGNVVGTEKFVKSN